MRGEHPFAGGDRGAVAGIHDVGRRQVLGEDRRQRRRGQRVVPDELRHEAGHGIGPAVGEERGHHRISRRISAPAGGIEHGVGPAGGAIGGDGGHGAV